MFDELHYKNIYQEKSDEELLDLYARTGLTEEARNALIKIFSERGIKPPESYQRNPRIYKGKIDELNKILANKPKGILIGIFVFVFPSLMAMVFSALTGAKDAMIFYFCVFLVSLLISYGLYRGKRWGLFFSYQLPSFICAIIIVIDLLSAFFGLYGNPEALIERAFRFLLILLYFIFIKLCVNYKSSKHWFQKCAKLRKMINSEKLDLQN